MKFRTVLYLTLTLIVLSRADVVNEALKYSHIHVKDIDTDLLKLAAIPSISSLPEHAKDIVAASEWLVEKMKASGLEVISFTAVVTWFNASSCIGRRLVFCDNKGQPWTFSCRMSSSCRQRHSLQCMLSGSRLKTPQLF